MAAMAALTGESAPASPAATSPTSSPPPDAPPGPRRRNLSYEEKLLVIGQHALEPHWTQETLALWAKDAFELETKPTQATISNILRASERLRSANVPPHFRSSRPVRFPELDAAVIAWVLALLAREEPVTRDAIQQHAAAVARGMGLPPTLSFSKGWVSSFMRRHQLHNRRSRKRNGADDDGADIFIMVVRNELASSPGAARGATPAVLVAPEEAAAADATLPPSPSSTATAAATAAGSSTKRQQAPPQRVANTASEPPESPAKMEVKPQLPAPQQPKQPQPRKQHQRRQQQAPPKPAQPSHQSLQQQQLTQQQQVLLTPSAQPLSAVPVAQQVLAPAPQALVTSTQPQAPGQQATLLQTTPSQPMPPPPKKQRRQSHQGLVLTPDKEKEQQLFDLECQKRQVDLEAVQVKLMVEKALGRKALLDAGIPEAEVVKLIPM